MKKTLCAILAVTMLLSTSVTAFGASINTPLPPAQIGDADMGNNIVRVNGQILDPANGGLDLIQIRMPFLANWAAVPGTQDRYLGNEPSFWGFDTIGSAVHTISTSTEDVTLSVHVVGFYEHPDTNDWVNEGIAGLYLAFPEFNAANSRIIPAGGEIANRFLGVDPLIEDGVAAQSFPDTTPGPNYGAPTPQFVSNLSVGTAWAPGHVQYIFTGSLERTAPLPGGVSHFEDLTGNPAPNDAFTLDTSHNLTFRFALLP